MHALGGINGRIYTNSLEAFEFNYQRGRRLFEVDLTLTTDGQVVAHHDPPLKMTADEFLSQKINGIYTPLSFQDLLDLMSEYSDIVIITDIKSNSVESNFDKTFTLIIKQVQERDPSLFARIVPQVYNQQNIAFLDKYGKFKRLIFAPHVVEASDQEVYEFMQANKDIKTVSMSQDRFSEGLTQSLKALGVEVFVHPLNAGEEIAKYLSAGAAGIYTDYY